MAALVRYQLALLLRSHRWLPPTVCYALLVVVGSHPGQPLGDSLSWTAAMLLPSVCWLTRTVLTGEPGSARACAAAGGRSERLQVAALTVAAVGGVVLMAFGTAYGSMISRSPAGGRSVAAVLASAAASSLLCILLGTAIGALCNPPVVRRTGYAILATLSMSVVGLAAAASPANAAIRTTASTVRSEALPLGPIGIGVALTAAVWLLSARLAAQRGET
jgi:hypothetical protein